MTCKLQPWVETLTSRMQGGLLVGLRGPDTHDAPNIKTITKWLRGIIIRPGVPGNQSGFMGGKPGRVVEKSPVARELEFCSQHYYSHLMHVLEIVGYRHPDQSIREHAFSLFSDMTALMHLPVEPKDVFEDRLKELEWPSGVQPDSYSEDA